jgi:hypothetical protein
MHNVLIGLDYRLRIRGQYICDIFSQMHWYSGQRLPNVAHKTATANNPLYPLESPNVFRWDMKISFPFYAWVKKRTKAKNFTFYFGIDNLLNSVQELPYIAQDRPFDKDFDGGLFWNSTVGRRYYGGVTYMFR